MTKMISMCGLDCAGCPAFLARLNNDQALREKTAVEWSAQFQCDFKAADINCVGCLVREGAHIGHCSECEMRLCGLAKGVKNCAHCGDYPCAPLSKFLEMVPPAKANLEEVRKSLKP
ncbi:MAG: DUF3795 domain-containing protein [Candidatus Riflebacteria bacterium]|nr:DUF3795 domain-containing protein [Candidatus Riflebacteria bacterium]